MLTTLRLRSSAALAAGLAALLLMGVAPVLAQEGPGPEELAALTAVTASGAATTPFAARTTSAPAPVPAVAGVGLPREVLEAAGAYRLYMRQAATVSATFENGASIAEALKLGAAYEPKQLTRGAVAFAAVAALHDADFVTGVRALGADPERRAALVTELVRAPNAASRLPSAETAAGRAVAALSGEGGRVHAVGLRVKQAAYEVQRQSWSKAEVSGRVERLAQVKLLSAQPLSAPATDLAELQLAALGAGRLDLPAGEPAPADRPVVARGLALAALAVLGEADLAKAEPLMEDAACGSCLRMSKLNLFQCLAVAKPWYEDVFCLGQHVLIDTGDCIQTAAVGKRAAPTVVPATVVAQPATPTTPPAVLTAAYRTAPTAGLGGAEPPAVLTTVAALQ